MGASEDDSGALILFEKSGNLLIKVLYLSKDKN